MQRIAAVLAAAVIITGAAVSQSETPSQTDIEAKKLFNEANGLYKAGNYMGAIEKVKGAISLHQDYRYTYLLGLCYKNTKQYDEAVKTFLASAGQNASFEGTHNALGGVYLVQGDFDKAIESFKKALNINSKLKPAQKGIGEAYLGKGQELMKDGKYERAGSLIDEALEQHSDNPKLYLLAARIYNRLEQPQKALDAANGALKQKKGRSKGAEYFEIGVAYKKLNDIKSARNAFAEAAKDPAYNRNAQYELEGLKGK
ncbi:MAG: tetratricopeptide repeat protein [Ignavibacteriales bacterium]|nr:tetratricopeptide repeat protein [Ignavibacteriales bacterium]